MSKRAEVGVPRQLDLAEAVGRPRRGVAGRRVGGVAVAGEPTIAPHELAAEHDAVELAGGDRLPLVEQVDAEQPARPRAALGVGRHAEVDVVGVGDGEEQVAVAEVAEVAVGLRVGAAPRDVAAVDDVGVDLDHRAVDDRRQDHLGVGADRVPAALEQLAVLVAEEAADRQRPAGPRQVVHVDPVGGAERHPEPAELELEAQRRRSTIGRRLTTT
jgi:hypothetical protein